MSFNDHRHLTILVHKCSNEVYEDISNIYNTACVLFNFAVHLDKMSRDKSALASLMSLGLVDILGFDVNTAMFHIITWINATFFFLRHLNAKTNMSRCQYCVSLFPCAGSTAVFLSLFMLMKQ